MPENRRYTVSVVQTYEVEAPDVEDAIGTVQAIFDRACEGKQRIVFDDDTTANLIGEDGWHVEDGWA